MNPIDRIKAQITGFNERHPDFDTTIKRLTVAPCQRGREGGLSLYAHTVDGIGFEEPLLPGEQIGQALGQSVN